MGPIYVIPRTLCGNNYSVVACVGEKDRKYTGKSYEDIGITMPTGLGIAISTKKQNLKKCERRPAVTSKSAWKYIKKHIKTHFKTFTMFNISENDENPKIKHTNAIF